jgi:hypothetical protein
VDDNVFGRDYTLNRVLANHNLKWGKGSRLFSTLQFFEREGFAGYQQFSWNERLRIQYTENLASRTIYRYFNQESETRMTTHEGSFELLHELYSNLDSSARLFGRSEKSDTLDRTEVEIGGRSSYQKSFFFGQLSAGIYGDYRRTDRQSEAGVGEVLNERHVARLVEPIILRKQLIHESTIVVTAEDGFIYAENIDYEVFRLGGVYTELRIIPNGRISAGDVLLISYRYEILPSAKFSSISAGYDFSLAYRWIRFFHNRYQYTHHLISGTGLPPDVKNTTSGIELTWDFDFASARLSGESRRRRNGGFKSKHIVLYQSLGVILTNQFSLSFSGNQVFSETRGVVTLDPLVGPEFQDNSSNADFYAFDATLSWFPRPGLNIAPSLGVWKRKEESTLVTQPNLDRLYYSAQLRVSWQLRKLAMDFFYDYNSSDEDGTIQKGNRLMFSIRRRFR